MRSTSRALDRIFAESRRRIDLIRFGKFSGGTWWDKTPDADNHTEIFPIMRPILNANPALKHLLIISGPNAGGKSVCLKTAGLLQYMFQCGMPVPVAKSSVFGIFRSIFIDIGDEQSLENDLSTYSSHLLNMKNMMKHCDGKSLILIDEFGGGTEPQIGGAMGSD